MKLEIDVPSWADDRNIYVMGGIELIAFKLRGGKLMIKSARCNLCGKCCQELGFNFPFADRGFDCEYLTDEPGPGDKKTCGLAGHRPVSCSIADPVMRKQKGAKDFCSIRYQEVK